MDLPESPGSGQSTVFDGSAKGSRHVEIAGDRKGLDEFLDGNDASMVSCYTNSGSRERSPVNEMVLPERNDGEGKHFSESGLTSLEDHAPKTCTDNRGEKSAFSAPLSDNTDGFVNFGGGRLSDGEEELQLSIADGRNQCLGSGKSTGGMDDGSDGRGNNRGTGPIRTRETSSPHNSGSLRQTYNSVHDVVKRLSEPLGMAVATVFYEVFEQAEFFGTDATAVDELSRLLEAALKESLRHVLGKDRGIFIQNFRNAFRGTFKTRRSVSRVYVKTVSKLSGSRKVDSSQGKALRNEGHVKLCGGNFNEAFIPGTRNRLKFAAGDGKTQTERLRRRWSHCMRTATKDEDEACDSTGCAVRDEQCDNSSHSSGKSCLDDSLQSYFFTDSSGDEPGPSETAGSCSTNDWNESSKSDSRYHVDDVTLESPLSQPTPDARDIRREQLGTEESEGDDVFFSSSSSEGQHLLSFGQDRTSEALLKNHGDSNRSSTVHKLEQAGDDDREPGIGHIHLNSSRKGGALAHSKSKGSSASSGNCTSVYQPGAAGTSSAGDSVNTLARRREKRPLTRSRRPMKCETGANGRSPGVSGVTGMGIPSSEGERAELCEDPLRQYGERMLVSRIPRQLEATRALMLPVGHASSFEANYALNSAYAPVMEYLALKSLKIDQTEKRIAMDEKRFAMDEKRFAIDEKLIAMTEDGLHLQSEANALTRDTNELKEQKLEDSKRTKAYQKLCQVCADELVAGLCLMLLALCFSTWKFSYARLSRAMAICQLPARERQQSGWFGMNWMSNSVESVAWHLKALTCEVTKAGRMVAGLILIAFVATGLFRKSATASSQVMPVTIIVVVLAGLCGFAGKISIDSLGGNGFLWVSLWETLCFMHLVATSWTPLLHEYLYGSSLKVFPPRKSIWLHLCSLCARFSFHSCLVFWLPVMAGLLPFASIEELTAVFQEYWGASVANVEL